MRIFHSVAGGSAMVYKFGRGMKIVKKLKKVRNEN